MIKTIIKDIEFLQQKSEQFIIGKDDAILIDMMDTANAHKENCAGLAAIQIGELKRVILVRNGNEFIPFINPVIVKKSGKIYIANEGCLSLDGTRAVKRWFTVMVKWTDVNGKTNIKSFSGYFAEILQHEIDHLNGILI